MKKLALIAMLALMVTVFAGCQSDVQAENPPATVTEAPEETKAPTPEPTEAPEATATPEPTATPKPTATPEPTATPKPTATPVPEKVTLEYSDYAEVSQKILAYIKGETSTLSDPRLASVTTLEIYGDNVR